jgi:predicted ABC-type ATPase
MAKSLQERAIRAGKDLIIPKVGDNGPSLRESIRKLQAEGYTVHLKYNEVTLANSLRRVGSRWRKTGRFVDTNYISQAAGNVPKAWNYLKQVDGVDWEHYNNDAANARLVARGSNRRKK